MRVFPVDYQLQDVITGIIMRLGPATIDQITEELCNPDMKDAVQSNLIFMEVIKIKDGSEIRYGFLDQVPGNCPGTNYEKNHEWGESKKMLTGDFEYTWMSGCKDCLTIVPTYTINSSR